LGNAAGDSSPLRDMLLHMGALVAIVKLLKRTKKPIVMRNAMWTLSNLCRGKPLPVFAAVAPAIPVVAHFVHSTDTSVLIDACWTASYLSDGPNERIDAIIQSGMLQRIVDLMLHVDFQVQTAALRCIGNIVTGNDLQTQCVINMGALKAITQLLLHFKKSILREACWMVANITAGTVDQIQSVLSTEGLVAALMKAMTSQDFDVKKEATYAICNAASGGSLTQIEFLVKCGCIKPLCDLLTSDDKITLVALEGLQNILEAGASAAENSGERGVNQYAELFEAAGGLETIENLQSHPNQDIYEKSLQILETFFDAGEEEPESTNGNATTGFNFDE